MNEPGTSLSIVTLFLNADIVVKGVLILLFFASVWSWAVIIDKLWRLAAISRSARSHEARAAAARSPDELWAGPRTARDPAGQVLVAGLQESAAVVPPNSETTGERRERVERAMRLALNGEMRRLETHLPFLATLGSALSDVPTGAAIVCALAVAAALAGVLRSVFSAIGATSSHEPERAIS